MDQIVIEMQLASDIERAFWCCGASNETQETSSKQKNKGQADMGSLLQRSESVGILCGLSLQGSLKETKGSPGDVG